MNFLNFATNFRTSQRSSESYSEKLAEIDCKADEYESDCKWEKCCPHKSACRRTCRMIRMVVVNFCLSRCFWLNFVYSKVTVHKSIEVITPLFSLKMLIFLLLMPLAYTVLY